MGEGCVKNPEKLMSLFMDGPLVTSQSENNVMKLDKIILVQKIRASQENAYQNSCFSSNNLSKNVHLKVFWTLFKNVHCRGPCSLRPCISRPYCNFNQIEQGTP